jgi:hypothetical protein
MIVPRSRSKYTNGRKAVTGRGFVDSLSSIFNSIKSAALPALKSVGSFVKENKDLIAKPILGAVGQLAATGISKGLPTLLSHIMNRKKKQEIEPAPAPILDDKSKEILQNILIRERPSEMIPATNIIGSGRKKYGKGLKNY